jgi:SRSO17 transposase
MYIFYQMWHAGQIKPKPRTPEPKGEGHEAREAYHIDWQKDDPRGCVPMGTSSAHPPYAHCSAFYPTRAASPRAGLLDVGILSATERKNGWQLAEHAREATPYGMQRLVASAVWDTDGVRDDVRDYVLEQLGCQEGIVVIDETSFPKRGKKSVGVQVQHCGTTGHVENCQVGVFLSYVSQKGHSLIDRELYLPLCWLEDQPRRREAGIPDSVRFQTKCELATTMVQRLWAAGVPIAWIVADTVYGGNRSLREWCEHQQYAYVLAVPCDEPIGIQTPTRRRRVQAVAAEALLLHAQDWQRLSVGNGTKGPRWFDWACTPILNQWEDDGRHWLLIRRCVDDPAEKTYYLVFAPEGTTLQEMVKAIGARWRIEEDFENAKDLGLDHYETRSWIAWYRCITLVMLAHAFLVVICAQEKACTPTSQALEHATQPSWPLLPLSVPEVRRLLGHLIWPHPCNVILGLSWSWWRRCHQSLASYFHTRRREAG